jgi:hypothetical protein
MIRTPNLDKIGLAAIFLVVAGFFPCRSATAPIQAFTSFAKRAQAQATLRTIEYIGVVAE